METKYGFDVSKDMMESSKRRLINQIWKLIPMWEKNEDWKRHLDNLIIEISGLNKIFLGNLNFIILLSKLEGLYQVQEFDLYRRTVFESIALLGDLYV